MNYKRMKHLCLTELIITLCLTVLIITLILQVHFDENQFENNRADERKLLRPYGKPNLLHLENNSVIYNMSTNDGKNVITFVSFT